MCQVGVGEALRNRVSQEGKGEGERQEEGSEKEARAIGHVRVESQTRRRGGGRPRMRKVNR